MKNSTNEVVSAVDFCSRPSYVTLQRPYSRRSLIRVVCWKKRQEENSKSIGNYAGCPHLQFYILTKYHIIARIRLQEIKLYKLDKMLSIYSSRSRIKSLKMALFSITVSIVLGPTRLSQNFFLGSHEVLQDGSKQNHMAWLWQREITSQTLP